MKKILLLLSVFLILFFLPQKVARAVDNCDATYTDESGNEIENTIYKSVKKLNYSFKLQDPALNRNYTVKACNMATLPMCSEVKNIKVKPDGTLADLPLDIFSLGKNTSGLQVTVELEGGFSPICQDILTWEEAPTPTPAIRASCVLDLNKRSNIQPGDQLIVIGSLDKVEDVKNYKLFYSGPGLGSPPANIHLSGKNVDKSIEPRLNETIDGKPNNSSFIADLGYVSQKGKYKVTALIYIKDLDTPFNFDRWISTTCSLEFDVPNGIILTPTPTPNPCIGHDATEARSAGDCSSTYSSCIWCITPTPKSKRPAVNIPNLKPLCDQLGGEFSGKCWDCQKTGGIWSAIGCLPTNFSELIKKYVFTTGVGIAGGIAFIYFLYGAFIILTSSGNAEKMEEAKQIITSALAGLFLIIFSVFLLSVIGIQILKLPGFG